MTVDVADEPGVLAAVAGVFGKHDVSIRTMEQVGLGGEARLSLLPILRSKATSAPCFTNFVRLISGAETRDCHEGAGEEVSAGSSAGTKPMVALDLDDLIYPFMQSVVPWASQHLNKTLHVDDFFTFNFEEVWGGTREESLAMMEKFFDEMTEHPAPIEGAVDAITKLSQEFDLSVITSRTDAMRDSTLDWIELHFSGTFIEVHLTNNYVLDDRPSKRRKVEVCKEIEAIALVDDSFINVSEAAAEGIAGILFGDFAWNRNVQLPNGVTRVHDWNEVTDQLLGLR